MDFPRLMWKQADACADLWKNTQQMARNEQSPRERALIILCWHCCLFILLVQLERQVLGLQQEQRLAVQSVHSSLTRSFQLVLALKHPEKR